MDHSAKPNEAEPPASTFVAQKSARPDEGIEDTLTAKLVEVLDQYIESLKTGTAPSREKLLTDHPELASQLNACLAGVEFIYGADGREPEPAKQLGDFVIGREIGRGGMGAVYEARQLSLGRTVALKVLRFGAVSDPEAIDRFKREAETVATLHHTNIVPIFSVGTDSGINYYAMQLIDGPSLHQVAAESNVPLTPKTVAGWGLQAAEALTHAHQREVIHRDVKPSNLLLDHEGRIWLTDFGLAKRLDDVTLSLTGALLGTPRYMSPEQAEAAVKSVDHRTDIYSLGATLYELVTGQPVFTADTPHDIISKIIHNEPLSPRHVRPEIPRDLETVLLKCLSKEAFQRYTTAQELADDLRAVVEDRPILARRPQFVERCVRWVKKRKRSVALIVTAAMVTLICASLVLVGRRAYLQSQLASLMLSSDMPGLIAEVSSQQIPLLVEALPTQHRLEIPTGSVQLHVSGYGELSQHFTARLDAEEQTTLDLALNDQRIGRKIPVERSFRLVPFSDGVDTLLLNQKEIRRWNAESDVAVWSLNMDQQNGSLLPGTEKIRWPWHVHHAGFATGSQFDQQPYVLGQLDVDQNIDAHRERHTTTAPIDLDLDGEIDVVMASREEAWVLAISGRTGKVLWLATRMADSERDQPTSSPNAAVRSATIAPPLNAGDLNADKVPDLITMFASIGAFDLNAGGPDYVPSKRWIEAISGKTGETLWSTDIDDNWLGQPDQGADTPEAFRWFVGHTSGALAHGSGGNQISGELLLRSRERRYERTGQFSAIPDCPRIIDHVDTENNGQSESSEEQNDHHARKLVFVAGTHVIQLDVRTGEQIETVQDTGILTARPARYADMDGDGNDDIVLCEQRTQTRAEVFGKDGQAPQFGISVWSIAKNALLWQKNFDGHWPRAKERDVTSPQWPVVSDLDGNGSCELLIPSATTSFGLPFPRAKAPWGDLSVIDGATGEQRWNRRLFTLDQQVDHFIAGPDVDHDGIRDVFVASLWGKSFDLFIDALSGADGHSLWRSKRLLNRTNQVPDEFWVGRLSWWQSGRDGWPRLAVSVHPTSRSQDAAAVYLFSAGTGQLQNTASGAAVVWSDDVNRDGIGDLCTFVPPDEAHARGEASLYYGVATESTLRLRDDRSPVCDLDGDGVRDLLTQTAPNQFEATSAMSNETLWASKLDVEELRHFEVLSQRGHSVAGVLPPEEQRKRDLDLDGTPDLLLAETALRHTTFSPLVAVSGRTGQQLWKADLQVSFCGGSPMVNYCDLDVDGRIEIVYVGAMNLEDTDRPSSQRLQLWLVVLSATDGTVKWKRPISPKYGLSPQFNANHLQVDRLRIESPTNDLNGDGVLDLVVPTETGVDQPANGNYSVALTAVSGRDGSLLWQHPLPQLKNRYSGLIEIPPVVATDLDGDQSPEIVSLQFEDQSHARPSRLAHIRVLEGGSGILRWEWSAEVGTSYGAINDTRDSQNRPRPIILKTRTGRPRIAVVLRGKSVTSAFAVQILSSEGAETGRIPLIAVEGFAGNTKRIFAHDVDSDGDDELIFWNRKAIVAMNAESKEILWQTPIATRMNAHLEGLLTLPANDERGTASTVAVLRQGSGDNSLIGVDTVTGKVRWKCVGLTSRSNAGWFAPDQVDLLNVTNDAPPQVWFKIRNFTCVRQAANLGDFKEKPSLASSNGNAIQYNIPSDMRAEAAVGPGEIDPRTLRDLPWRLRFVGRDIQQVKHIAGLSVLFCVLLIAIPFGTTVWQIRRRRIDSLTVAAFVIAALSLVIGICLGTTQHELSSVSQRFLAALAVLPLLWFVGLLIRYVFDLNWRFSVLWLLVSVVVSLVLAGVVLMHHASQEELALQPFEEYSFAGWYMIGVWGTYITGVVMLLFDTGRSVLQMIRRREFNTVE